MNGSPLFTGDAGSGESEIRRWILESDWLETIVALPGQLFYNTGINTYIWVLSNRKPKDRKSKVLLVNGAATRKEGKDEVEVFAQKMRKSLGDKRNELSEEHIRELARLAGALEEGPYCKIFDTADFGYRKITVERPLRLNFCASGERINRLRSEPAFLSLCPDGEKAGKGLQKSLIAALQMLGPEKIWRNRDEFLKVLDAAMRTAGIDLAKPLKKAILSALSERDEKADICKDSKGNPELDPELRDYENVPLKEDIYAYFDREVRPHVPDAWINEDVRDEKDGKVGKVGYEVNFNRNFYQYEPPRSLEQIDADIKTLEAEILKMLGEVAR
jgi:type I restriction enzyme M protein